MSLNPRLPPKQRYETIKEYITRETLLLIAKRCGCNQRTINRDIVNMKKIGEWWEFLERAMLHYGQSEEVSDETKFKEYSKLYGKQFIKEKIEKTTQLDLTKPITLIWGTQGDEPETES